jgi:hypothetical protein
MHAGQPALGGCRLPVITAGLNGETPFPGQIGDIAHPEQGILQVGGDNGKIFRIESDKSQEIHGGTNLLLNFKV